MKILFLSHRIPYPPDKGDKIRSFHELQYFSRTHEINLLAFYEQPSDLQYAAHLNELCRSVTLLPLKPWPQRLRAASYMASGRPWSLGYFQDPAMARAVARSVASSDLVFVFSSSMAPYVAGIDGIPKVLDFVDSDSSKWRQYAQFRRPSFLYSYEAKHLAAFEQRILASFDCSVFVSPREAAHLRNNGNIRFIQNGIDLEAFSAVQPNPSGRTLVFAGAMDYFPNADAVTFFAREVLPLLGSAHFLIVGSRPGNAVRSLAGIRGVTVTGTVPDVRPYLAQSRVAVVPVRISQGIQNKILEALAAGLPVVTTSKAAAGLDVDDLPVRIADDPQSFARHTLYYLGNPLSPRQIEDCRTLLRQHYDWQTNLSAFDRIFSEIRAIRGNV